MVYQCGSCQYFNPGASMCFSYFYHQTFRFTARNGIVLWTWGSWDSKGKETFFARGWEKNCPSAKKGHWRARTWHRFFRSDMKKGRQTTETIWCIWCLIHVDCCIIQIYPKHPKTSQNIHVACVGSKSLVQIDTAGRQTCSPWQRFRFRPCSQVHPVSPSARPNQQKQPKKDQK